MEDARSLAAGPWAVSAFDEAFAAVVGNEGGFGNNPADPGNWTGGAVGAGTCRGTKWGISAAAYPTLDIEKVTEGDARVIYLARYWTPISAALLAPALALLVFDAAVNNGVGRAVMLLQAAVGAEQDGLLGPQTLARVAAADASATAAEFQARRLLFMVGLPTWHTFGLGWARRLCRLPFQAQIMTASLQSREASPSPASPIEASTRNAPAPKASTPSAA